MDARVAEAIAPAARDGPLSLYVHMPFCATKCTYCDFNTYARIERLMPRYVVALAAEIRRWGSSLGKPVVSTVFVGGGTPSYLPSDELAGVARSWRSAFAVAPDAEVTVEANPDDLSTTKLQSLRPLANRLSVGVQALDDALLMTLGRRHDSGTALEAVRAARRAEFDNISVDLMYGLPGQSLDQWLDTLERAVDLAPDHMSLYALTLEPGTPMAADVAAGRIPEPDADLAADMYLLAREMLETAGFLHYEISNWARPGRESKHNLAYWVNASYLGVGPGAHSSLSGRRFANMKSPRGYIHTLSGPSAAGARADPVEAMRAAGPVEEVEMIDEPLEMAESMMMGLRLRGGVSLERFRARFGADLRSAYAEVIDELVEKRLVEIDEHAIRIPPDAWLLANEALSRFVSAKPSRPGCPAPA